MKRNENSQPFRAASQDELELELQEALARRQRASELFGLPDWESEDDDDGDSIIGDYDNDD